MSTARPPRWARRVARVLVPEASREFVLGDLEELFGVEAAQGSRLRATLSYLGRSVRSAMAHVRSGGPFEDLMLDLRFAVRGLRRNPTFTVVSAATMAIGMGATTAMLSVADAILFRPPPIEDPDRMVAIWEFRSGEVWESMEGRLLPYARTEAYREATGDVFEGLAAHHYRRLTVTTDQGAEAVSGFITSGNYFDLLGLTPRIGRLFTDDDEESVVLSERLWESRFGADPGVVGRTLAIDSRSFTVAGVASSGFVGTMSGFTGDVWVPWGSYTRLTETPEDGVRLVPLARLRPGISRVVAEDRVAEVARSIEPHAVHTEVDGARLDGILWRTDLVGILRLGAAILTAASGLLLLIAGANIGGMMLARSHDRRKETAVRLAMGASGGRMVRQMLTESALLALIGGAGGVALAWIGTEALSTIPFPIDATISVDMRPDGRILLASFALAAMAGILFGLGPALRSARTDLNTSLKEGGRGLRMGGGRNLFVVAQITLCTVLLLTAGVLARSFAAVVDVPLGFEPSGVTVATIALGPHDYDRDQGREFYRRLEEGAATLPGVESVGLGRLVLLGGANESGSARLPGAERDDGVSVAINVVDPGYFEVTGVTLVAGRFFDGSDDADALPVAIVNESMADELWPGQPAIGQRFVMGRSEYVVVGVAQNGVYAFVYEDPQLFSYFPFAQDYRSGMALHVKSAGPSVASDITELVRRLDPNLAVSGLRTMDEVIETNRFGPSFFATLSSLFAGIGLLLAAIGIYGLLAVQVSQQGREFGVRMALGAKAGDVLRIVIGRGLRISLLGCALGLVVALVSARWLSPLLYSVSPFDLVTFVMVPLVLTATALAASVIPARRGTRVSPVALLREE